MTYSQITAFDLLNEGTSKMFSPTHPQDHHLEPRMSKSNAGHRQTERKQAGKVQTMNFSPHQLTPSPPDDNPYHLRPYATPRDTPASGKTQVPDSPP